MAPVGDEFDELDGGEGVFPLVLTVEVSLALAVEVLLVRELVGVL